MDETILLQRAKFDVTINGIIVDKLVEFRNYGNILTTELQDVITKELAIRLEKYKVDEEIY